MTDALAQFGEVDLGKAHGSAIRNRVAGRTVHIDGDFIAYQIAADTRDEKDGIRPMRDLKYKITQIEDIATSIMERAGGSKYVLHVTPSGSTKGGRAAQAVQKEYQANRGDRVKPEHLDAIRAAIADQSLWPKHGSGIAHLHQEADDGLAQANIADLDNSILVSRDKDLRMVPGWHMDEETGEMVFINPTDFGTIALDDSKSSKKVVGYGPAFFWAQCLMGDTADNIQGLPAVSGYCLDKRKDVAAWEKRAKEYAEADDLGRKRTSALWLKTKACGAVMAYNLLKDVDNNRDAFHVVKELFQNLEKYGMFTFRHWKTTAEVSPTQALFGDMQCLWMRHTDNQNDVVRWLKTFV